ncbi:exp1-like protein [Mortierella claussenii]|nr:exp1-like protein [Mortierella claussenii]
MLSLSAFRTLSLSSLAVPTQAIRTMAVKAASASAVSSKATAAKTTSAKGTKSSTKATTGNKGAKAAKAAKAIKASDKPAKAKKVVSSKSKNIPALELPKRPNTSYTMFFVEYLDKLKASGEPCRTPIKEASTIAALWKEMSDSQKKPYEDKFKANRAAYKTKMEERLSELTLEEFKRENSRRNALRAAGKKTLPNIRDPNAPKRPLTSFFLFSEEMRGQSKFDSLPLKDRARAFGELWASTPDSEKAPYVEQARLLLEKYKAARAAYEAEKQ